MAAVTQPTSFNFPTPIRFGVGVIAELPAYCKKHGLTAPLLVTDPNVAELGFFRKIAQQLAAAGLKPEVFSDMHANPIKADVLAGGDAYDQSQRDSIIGIGGGAAMDVARAIALRINHREDLFKYDDLIGGDKYVTNPIPPFVTVPTTSGTGSEVGRSAIISEDESKKKRILFAPSLMAQQVFADPALTFELPTHITAATGIDALTHNLEAYLAKNYHPMADGIALEGTRLIFESIVEAVHRPDPVSRSKMMLASLMGATAFQKGLGVVHSLAHPLSTLLDMHHGLANAINLPYGMEFNFDGFETRFTRLAQVMNLPEANAEAVVPALFELNEKLNLPLRLREKGVEQAHIPSLTELAVADFAHPNNPKPVSREDFQALYEKAW
ncbi:MAG: iron-containing alcohol dehydrogenase [Bacteroidota bacterium]